MIIKCGFEGTLSWFSITSYNVLWWVVKIKSIQERQWYPLTKDFIQQFGTNTLEIDFVRTRGSRGTWHTWPFLLTFYISKSNKTMEDNWMNHVRNVYTFQNYILNFGTFFLSFKVCSALRSVWLDMGSCPFVPKRTWLSTCFLLPPGWPACWPSWRSNSLESDLHSLASNSL